MPETRAPDRRPFNPGPGPLSSRALVQRWNMPFEFAGKRVLVCGGTSGIGAAVARAFDAAGAQVVAAGLPGEAHLPASVSVRPLDIRDTAAVAALAGGLDRLDVLVNAAGLTRRG